MYHLPIVLFLGEVVPGPSRKESLNLNVHPLRSTRSRGQKLTPLHTFGPSTTDTDNTVHTTFYLCPPDMVLFYLVYVPLFTSVLCFSLLQDQGMLEGKDLRTLS